MTITRLQLCKVLPPDSIQLGPPSCPSGTAELPGWGKGARRGETRPYLQWDSLCRLTLLSGSWSLLWATSRVLEQCKESIGEGYFWMLFVLREQKHTVV